MEKISLPIQVRYRDLDTFGHVNSAVYLTYFEMARVKLLLDYFKTHPKFKFVVAKTIIEYLSPIILTDQIVIHCWVDHIGNSSFTLKYKITNDDQKKTFAMGETIQVNIGENGKKAPLPNDFLAFIEKYYLKTEK